MKTLRSTNESGIGAGNQRKVHPADQGATMMLSQENLLVMENEPADDSRSRLVGAAAGENEFSFNDTLPPIKKGTI